MTLNLAGLHNVRNALAAVAVAHQLGLPDDAVMQALAKFAGVGRRFQSHGLHRVPDSRGGGAFEVVDDYGHHPVELAAVLDAARAAYPSRRLVLVFQPHRYTRTRDCFEDFVKVLSQADVLILTEVYAASESPIVAADGRSLARAIRVTGKVEPIFVERVQDVAATLLDTARDGDLVLVMGAGSVERVVGDLRQDALEDGGA